MPTPRITTCNYCGTRAALVLTGVTRHELTCGTCGAPLQDIKHIKTPKPKKTKAQDPWAQPARKQSGLEALLGHPQTHKAARKLLKTGKKRKRKSGFYLAAKVIGDLLD